MITGHRLEVVVEEAREIKATNFFSTTESDAFCELSVLDGIVKKTEVQFKTLTPTWNEKFTLYVETHRPTETHREKETFVWLLTMPGCGWLQ